MFAAPPRPAAEDLSKIAPDVKMTAVEFYEECAAHDCGSGEVQGQGHRTQRRGLRHGPPDGRRGVSHAEGGRQPDGRDVHDHGPRAVEQGRRRPEGEDQGEAAGLRRRGLPGSVRLRRRRPVCRRPSDGRQVERFAADPEAVATQFKDKYLVVTGEVVSKEFNSPPARIVLKSNDKVKVACSMTAMENKAAKEIKAGQTVTMAGQFMMNFGSDEVGLYFCLPITTGIEESANRR